MKTSKIIVPKGFKFKIEQRYGDTYIRLMNNKDDYAIGWVNLEKDWLDKSVVRTHSYLKSEYRHQGFGTLMYARAIQWALQHKYKIRSSGMSSIQARRLWDGQGLRKYFHIKKRQLKDRSFVWYAYPKR